MIDPKEVASLPPADEGTKEIIENISEDFTEPPPIEEENNDLPDYEEGFTSPSGETFDPRIHVSKDSITKKGNFRRKRNAKIVEETFPENTISMLEEQRVNDSTLACAETGTFFFLQIGKGIFGEDFKASKDEHVTLVASLQKYLISQGVTDLPPGLGCAIAFGGFTVSKMRHDTCRTKAKGFFQKVKDKIALLFLKIKNLRKRR